MRSQNQPFVGLGPKVAKDTNINENDYKLLKLNSKIDHNISSKNMNMNIISNNYEKSRLIKKYTTKFSDLKSASNVSKILPINRLQSKYTMSKINESLIKVKNNNHNSINISNKNKSFNSNSIKNKAVSDVNNKPKPINNLISTKTIAHKGRIKGIVIRLLL